PEERIALRVKTLHVRAMRDGRQEVRTDLGLFVVGHGHPERDRHTGDAPPLCGSTSPRRIEIADIDGAVDHEVTSAGAREFALSCRDRNTGGEPHVAHRASVVVPTAWLLEPTKVQILDQVTETLCLLERVPL